MKNLLNSVNLIISKYKEIEKITGEHYNIFSVMGMENNELKTHSAIIGDLLNAKGSHLMGDIFLKLFIETIKNQSESQKLKYFSFESQNSNCLIEEFIGKTNKEEITGGRIDLAIKDSQGNVIIIENKIFAPEQENQIQRYKNAYPNGAILYLTLDRKDSVTAGDLVVDEDYYLICYEKSIINWLELCLKETFNQPILRETLKQYIVLIKKLTNQSTNKKMSEEIIKIIEENFEASAEIYKNYIKALENKQLKFLQELKIIIEDIQQENWIIEIGKTKNDNSLILKNDENNCSITYRFKNAKNPVIRVIASEDKTEILGNLGYKKSDYEKGKFIFWKMEIDVFNLDYFDEEFKFQKQNQIKNELLTIIQSI